MDTGLLKVIGDLKKEIKRLEGEDNEMSKSEVNQHWVIDVAATVPVTISGHLIYGIAALVILVLVQIYFWRRDKFGRLPRQLFAAQLQLHQNEFMDYQVNQRRIGYEGSVRFDSEKGRNAPVAGPGNVTLDLS